MHYMSKQNVSKVASGNSASGCPQHLRGDSFDCCPIRYEIVVYYSLEQSWNYFLLRFITHPELKHYDDHYHAMIPW